MDKAQALYNFWAGFDLPAYDENRVPEDATFPRITYETAVDNFGNEIGLTASLWYKSMSWEEISRKASEIASKISMGGIILKTDDGALWIKRGTPYAQRMEGSDDSTRRIVINISAEFFEQD